MWSAGRGRRVGVNEKRPSASADAPSLCSRKNSDAWPPVGAELHRERRLENLFEQLALIDARGRTDTQAAAALHQDDLVGIFRGEVQFVRDDDDGVAIFSGEPPQRIKQTNLGGDIQVESGFIEHEKQRLL